VGVSLPPGLPQGAARLGDALAETVVDQQPLGQHSQTDARYLIGDGEDVGVTRRGSFNDFSGEVYALALTDSALYVGGVFDKAGKIAASGIALFHVQRGWQALGSGVSSMYTPYVYALAAVGNNVYVGGDFSAAGTAKTAAIARWDAVLNRWQTMNDGLSAEASVKALAILDGSVYVGGHFVSAGDAPAAGFSRWGPPIDDPNVRSGQNDVTRPVIRERNGIPTRVNRTPTLTPTATPIVTPIVTGTRTPTATYTPTRTATTTARAMRIVTPISSMRTPTVVPTAKFVAIPTRVNLTPTVTPTATQIITPIVTGTRTPTATPCPTATASPQGAASGLNPCGR